MRSQPFTILMADDDMEDLELMEESIRNYGGHYRFHKVLDGKSALEYLALLRNDQLPCIIILDYNMPDLNGLQVLSELSKEPRYSNISKIILSTSGEPTHIKECKENGAIDYFVKPTNLNDLKIITEKLLNYCVV